MKKSKIALIKSVFVKSGITLLAVMFVLGLAACPSPTGTLDGDKPPKAGNDATLAVVKFAGAEAALGTPASTYAGITAPGSITLLSGSAVSVVAMASDPKAAIQYAKVTGDETPNFFYDTTFDYEPNGDALAIEVIAEDNTTRLYYRINVTVADVALESLTIGGKAPTPAIPAAAADWQLAIAGSVLFAYPVDEQPEGGLAVAATTATEGAIIEYGQAEGSNEPIFNAASNIKFKNGEFLYVRVIKENSVAYYKVQINFQMKGTIRYGSPQVADNFIDPLWDDGTLDVYRIEKPYPNDCSDEFMAALDTFGEARALWDEQGLYLYVKVTDPDVSESGGEGSRAHEVDSVELFVNEAYPNTSYSNGGSQYRVGANGERSGEGNSPVAMDELNKTSAWKTNDGYIVIFQVPWRLRNRFPITDGKEIGFEIQLNAAPETGSRYGVMVWNNVAHTNYQNAGDYGVATLDANGISLSFPAVPPSIDVQPQSARVSGGEPITLTVAANVLPENGGTLSYQWYIAETSSGEGTPIEGQIDASYTFNAPLDEGRYYYYVVVTNTLNGSAATTRSSSAVINISGEEIIPIDFVLDYIDNPLMNASAVDSAYSLIQRIDLGEEFDITQYEKFTFEVDILDEDEEPLELENWNSIAQIKWRDTPGTLCVSGSTSWRWDLGNIGPGLPVITNANIPAYLLKVGQTVTLDEAISATTEDPVVDYEVNALRYLDFESAGNWANSGAKYLVIKKITFHVPE